jgi:hypothetical protein
MNVQLSAKRGKSDKEAPANGWVVAVSLGERGTFAGSERAAGGAGDKDGSAKPIHWNLIGCRAD